jgi:hypothetical protein
MAKPKKKKATPEQMHRNLQDNVQALPYAIAQMEKEGKRGKAFLLKYVTGPWMRLMKRILDRQRYKGDEGAKLKQTEQMKRHLEQRQKAVEYMQAQIRQQQQRQAKRQGKRR